MDNSKEVTVRVSNLVIGIIGAWIMISLFNLCCMAGLDELKRYAASTDAISSGVYMADENGRFTADSNDLDVHIIIDRATGVKYMVVIDQYYGTQQPSISVTPLLLRDGSYEMIDVTEYYIDGPGAKQLEQQNEKIQDSLR